MTLLFLGKRCLRVILMTTRTSLIRCSWKMPLQEPLDPGTQAWGGHRFRLHELCWTWSSLRWSVTNQAGPAQSGSYHRDVPRFCEPGSFGWKCHLPSIVFQHNEIYLKALCFYKEEDQTFIDFPGTASRFTCTQVLHIPMTGLISLFYPGFPFTLNFLFICISFLCVNFTFRKKFIVQWNNVFKKWTHTQS